MIRLMVPIENLETMEKARAGLVFRTDLPYHLANGALAFRRGWVKPEDVPTLNQAKKTGDAESMVGKYTYEADMFDDAEGEAWEALKKKETMEEPAPAPVEAVPEVKKPKWQVSTEPYKSKGHIAFFGPIGNQKEVYEGVHGDIWVASADSLVTSNMYGGQRSGYWKGPASKRAEILQELGVKEPDKTGPKPDQNRTDPDKGGAPLYIEDLSEKAIIIKGDTRTHKDAIKAAGGKWNGKYGGWIFPKKWLPRVKDSLGKLLGLGGDKKPDAQGGPTINANAVQGESIPKTPETPAGQEPPEAAGKTEPSVAGNIPEGWGEGSKGGLATNKDPVNGGIIDKNKFGWFVIPNLDGIKQFENLPTREAAFKALAQAIADKAKADKSSTIAERISKPEMADGEEAKTGDVQSDIEQPIAKMKFADYGSWSASGKHVSPDKRMALNQQIAELLLLPSGDITPQELQTIRQYSGFGGVKADDERGVLYDYFTSPPVARMVWKLANKIVPLKSGARALEPSCGAGVFFEVAPQGIDLTGVEFDSRTSAVAGLLQPQARIYHSSFEQFNLHQKEKFDAVIGNAPFGDRSVATSFLDEPGEKSLDKYFVSRSLDNLKGGGTMALIVAPGVMDNVSNQEWRSKMLRKGQFIGAMRLPNQSFKHTNTGVSPDIVMFRAYPEDIRSRLAVMSDEEMKTAGFYDDAWVDGTYYDENPGHRLGRVERGQFDSEVTVGKLEPADMDRALEVFEPRALRTTEDFGKIRNMTQGKLAEAPDTTDKLSEAEASAVAAKTLRVGMTKSENGKIYRLNSNHRWELVQAGSVVVAKLDRMKEISETVRMIREAMRADEPVDDLQRQARSLIEAYEKDFGVKHSEDGDIKKFVKANAAIANVYEAMTIEIDSDLLTKQNVYHKEIEIVDGHRPAIRALMEIQRDMVDATNESIKARYPNDADALIEAMWSDPDVFVDETGIFRLREDFISGNAWQKIDALEKAIADHPGDEWARNREKWQAGAEAMRDAVGWIPIEDADVFPQGSWIPEDIINRWAEKGMKRPATKGYRYAKNEEGKWGLVSLADDSKWDWKTQSYKETPEGFWQEENDEFIYFLNNQKQRSKYTDTETYNKNAVGNFKAWLATDDASRKEMEELYNRNFNTELGVPTKTYAVHLDGWSDNIVLKPWQWQTIHHLYRQGKGISALGTGFGKTYAAIGLYALLRQEGKAKRAFFQVPNNKVKDWVEDFGKTMPGLKIGSVDPEAKGYNDQAKRFSWYQELASGDYDVIILPESSASEIQLNAENDDMIVDDIASQITSEKGKTQRKKEQALATAEGKLSGGKKNVTITFEELGCDTIFCDEMHRMKNLFTSSLSRETEISDGRRSDRALSFFKKCEYMRRGHDGKGVFGLTATPLTNSPLEYYNMLQHIAPEMLASMGIANIDSFINNFADIQMGQKYSSFNGKVTDGKILVGFKNLRTLQDMFFKYTDLQDDPTKIGLKKPTPTNRPNILPMQEAQAAEIRAISAEVEKYRKMTKEQREAAGENFLTFYTRIRTASLDLELYDPVKFKGWKNPKIEKMAESAMETFKARGGGQVIFCDRVVSSDGSMNMHDKIKAALVAKGFKENEIVIVNGLTKSGSKASDQALERDVSEAIDGYNGKWESGKMVDGVWHPAKLIEPPKYKIIIGTTQTIGEGVNLQKNSSALHHLDIPFRPSDFTQRNGRVDRQGNTQETVELHTYATAGTIDNYSVALVAGKQNWINQLLKTKQNVFTNPNGEGMDMDEILLSLTEEWGDLKGADEKRKALADKKALAIQENNQKKAHDYLKQLSLMRGSLVGYKGDKGSRDYQNRLRKIDNIEAGLQTNPEFRHPEILGREAGPFMYDEGRQLVVQKGDLIVQQGKVSRVSELDYKGRSYSLLSAIDSTTSNGKQDAYKSANVQRSYYSDKEDAFIHIAHPSIAEVDKYIAMVDMERFYKQPLEFKRDNYEEFVKLNGSGYNGGKMKYLVIKKDGEIEGKAHGSMYKGESVFNPFTDKGRKKIRAALVNGKMTPTTYRGMEEVFGDLGASDVLHEAAIKTFESNPVAKNVIDTFKTAKKYSNGEGPAEWVSLIEIAERISKDPGQYDEYDVKKLLRNHPDIEIEYQSTVNDAGGYGYYARWGEGVQKALGHGKIVAKGERVYVLQQRRH